MGPYEHYTIFTKTKTTLQDGFCKTKLLAFIQRKDQKR